MRHPYQSILIIGYGNLLRSDDGVGHHIAQAIANWQIPGVEAIAVHQLTPELAEKLATVDTAIFVDAYWSKTEEVQIHALDLGQTALITGHWCDPSVLLATTQALYGCAPRSWMVMVPGNNFDLGEHLSCIAQRGLETALKAIQRSIDSSCEDNPCTKSE